MASVDGAAVVRAASRGFTVFLFGGVVQPLVGAASSVVGAVWLPLVAVAACVAAAWSAAGSEAPLRHGASAALGAYALVVPVVYIATQQLDVLQIASTSALALVVGGLTGWLRGRHSGRASKTSLHSKEVA
ncbi:hypothetical protein ACW14X_28765 [Nocardioides sp. YJ-D4]